MEVTDSDHKPVWALLTVDMPVVIQDRKREGCCRLLQQGLAVLLQMAHHHLCKVGQQLQLLHGQLPRRLIHHTPAGNVEGLWLLQFQLL